MNVTVTLISSVSILLLISALTAWISNRIKLPPTIMLVIVGYLLSHLAGLGPDFIQHFSSYQIDPEIILYACLPTLIFESAFNMDAKLFRRNIWPILTLAVPGLFFSTLIIGLIVWSFTSMELIVALLLGAILSATDPVAVISLFKKLGVPKRLTILVEGESLLNDSTAIVTAKTLLFIMLAGAVTGTTVLHGAQDFILEFFGGIAVGCAMAVFTGYLLIMAEEEAVIGLSLTVILAYLSFIIADKVFHVSGVMATISAGIVMAGWGRTKLSAKTDTQLKYLLDFLSYIANALIFLLVGLSINLSIFMQSAWILCVTIVAMLASRALVIFGLIPILNRLSQSNPIDLRYQTIMWWGGLRGAIAVAIVLGLPGLAEQKVLEAVVMGAVLFTILIQGLSIERIIQWFKLDKPILFDEVSKLEAEIISEQVALERLKDLQKGGMFSLKIIQDIKDTHQQHLEDFQQEIKELKRHQLSEKEERRILYLRCFLIEKNLYYDMFFKGHLSEHTFRTLNNEIEIEIDMMRSYAKISDKLPMSRFKRISLSIINFLASISWFERFADRMRMKQTIHDYEEVWGLHQGCVTVLNFLDHLYNSGTFSTKIINELHSNFKKWHKVNTQYLDAIAEQFPEFVHDMQQRLGNRLLLQAKVDTILEEEQAGIQPAITQSLIEKYQHKIKLLKKVSPAKLILDPHELVTRVPFFKHLAPSDFDKLISLFHEMHYPADKIIITEGEIADVFYIIMRGVVRILKNEKEIATLIAGDFFGEISLLYDVPRTATCKTVTPCLLYSIDRTRFADLLDQYPQIRLDIEREAKKRQAENKEGV